MAHKISRQRARQLFENDLECRKLQAKGIDIKSKRWKKRQARRHAKENKLMAMLKRRGGLFKPKEEKAKEKQTNV